MCVQNDNSNEIRKLTLSIRSMAYTVLSKGVFVREENNWKKCLGSSLIYTAIERIGIFFCGMLGNPKLQIHGNIFVDSIRRMNAYAKSPLQSFYINLKEACSEPVHKQRQHRMRTWGGGGGSKTKHIDLGGTFATHSGGWRANQSAMTTNLSKTDWHRTE